MRASEQVMDDREAIDLCRRGRPEGFRVLFDRYAPFLLTLATRMLGDRHLAEDAVQEAFAAAFAGLDGFRGEARVKTWLYTILYRAALRLRDRRRHELPAAELPAVGVAGHAPAVEDRLAVREVLDRLPDRDREVLVMAYWDDLTCQEIAEVMGLTANHVKVLLFRARERFARSWPAAALEAGAER
ncbi:MAG: sigma-70 family RNA polymerase sigma factor [Candidatus Riflebacteria bacterium]|nr:sigma-70 family RNA polymerase sigma factor [Candidatus Riflebacteria bacterium]